MTAIKQEDLIQSIADAFQYISYYHPLDYIKALGEAYEREESPAAKDAIAQILTNSRMAAEGHPDQPEWLSHVNAGVLKIKLSTAIIGISSIHLLKTFINAANIPEHTIMWQVIIHVVFLVSALAMAMVDKIMNQTVLLSKH